MFLERLLQSRQQGRVIRDISVIAATLVILFPNQVPGGNDDLALPFRHLVLRPALLATTAGLLRLRVAPIEGLHVDEEHIRTCSVLTIFGNRVIGNQVARD